MGGKRYIGCVITRTSKMRFLRFSLVQFSDCVSGAVVTSARMNDGEGDNAKAKRSERTRRTNEVSQIKLEVIGKTDEDRRGERITAPIRT